ncbi:MAG TPA: hypothetical protein VEL51_23725 [Vicinamibacterales bacterium]|nr:hypothetical protein [Vicinamibacterales bacterium]
MPSETGARSQARSDLSDSAVRAQLDRILGSAVFSRSQQLRRFLTFIVEQTLTGQGHTLKEAVLAHEVYGKGLDFDGGTDPVVRVDARRLRDKLREYYEGRSDPVVISLPKGSYVPVFEANSASPTHTAPQVVLPELQASRPVTNPSRARLVVVAVALVAAVMAVVLAWRALRPADAPAQLLPLASYPGVEGPPALSPDGNLVAFAWSGEVESGPTDIYVKAVGSEALQRLTDTPDSESGPAWSADGQSIAFVRDGSNRHAVLISVGGWSPDGALITFDAAIDGNTDVYVVGTDGGHLHRVTSEASVDGVPSWSADGRWIYFSSTRAGVVPDVWRISRDGGEAIQMTRNGGFEPQESSDGRYLFYLDRYPAGLAIGGTARVMRAPLAGGPAAAVVDGVRPFLWSVTDSGIVFLTREPDSDAIHLYRFSDQRVARVGRLGFRTAGIFRYMTASRNGRWASASKMVRFESDLMRLDNFR